MIILKKELKRIFTDRRLVLMLVVLPLVMLPLMYSFMGRASKSRRNDIAEYHSRVAVLINDNSGNFADILFTALEPMNTQIFLIDEVQMDSISQLVTDGDMEVILVVPDDADGSLEAGTPIELSLYHNSTADYSESAIQQLFTFIGMLNEYLVEERISEAGLSPDVLTAVSMNSGTDPGVYDLAGEGSLIGKIIGMMVPFFIVIYLFANSMKVGLDSVAGEKERGTLAILLVNQVGRLSIVLGKMFSVMTAAIVGAVSSAIGLKIASRYLIDMASDGSGSVSEFTMGTTDFLQFGIIVIPLAVLISSIVLLVSTFARNVKEGQGMIMPVYVAVMVMGITTMQSGDIPPGWMRIAPIFNSLVVLKDVFLNNAVWQNIIFATGTSLVFSAILIFVTLRMFNNERILFRV